jgi:hypothetical protein
MEKHQDFMEYATSIEAAERDTQNLKKSDQGAGAPQSLHLHSTEKSVPQIAMLHMQNV